jgi:ParB family chromosome partitioning protein
MGAARAMLDGVSDSIVRESSQFQHSIEIPLDRIQPDPDQPRKIFDDEETAALARTMVDQGQLQAILVRRDPDTRGSWLIVAGERRWRAAQLNGWKNILAVEHTGDAEVATLVENLQRLDLSAVEEARGLQRLISGKGWSQTQAAQALGKTDAEVSSTLRILTLPENLLNDLLATKNLRLSRYVLAELARLEPGLARDRLLAAARAGELTQRMVRVARKPQAALETSVSRAAQSKREGRMAFRSVDRVAVELRELRKRGGGITEAEVVRLKLLRDEIDSLLRVGERI